MLTLLQFTGTDNISLYFGLYFVLPITVVYAPFLCWFCFYHVRRLVFINQRDLFLEYYSQLPGWILEKEMMTFEQI